MISTPPLFPVTEYPLNERMSPVFLKWTFFPSFLNNTLSKAAQTCGAMPCTATLEPMFSAKCL